MRFGCVHLAFLPLGGRLIATMNTGDGSAEPPNDGVIIGDVRGRNVVLGRSARAAASTSNVTSSKRDAILELPPRSSRFKGPELRVSSVCTRLEMLD